MTTIDRDLAEQMLGQSERNLAYARSRMLAGTDDRDMLDMALHAIRQIAHWSAQLGADFRGITGASR